MAKRQGKAATRRQRQRSANRSARPAAPSMPARGPDALDRADPITEAAATSTTQATAPAARHRAPPPASDPRAAGRRWSAVPRGSPSRRATEYHYVTADLRNIAILSLVVVGLLAVAFVVIEVLGIGRVAT